MSGILSINNLSTTGGLNTLGDASFNGRLYVGLDASFSRRLFVGQDTSLNGNLFVNKLTIHAGDVSINTLLFIGSDVSMATRLFIGGDLSVNGNVNINGQVTAPTPLSTDNSQKVATTAYVKTALTALTGASATFSGDVSVNYRLYVGSDASLQGRLYVNNDASFNQRLYVGGDVSFGNRLYVAGDVSMGGSLGLAGGNFYMNNSKSVIVNPSTFGSATGTSSSNAFTMFHTGQSIAVSYTGQYLLLSDPQGYGLGVVISTNYGATVSQITGQSFSSIVVYSVVMSSDGSKMAVATGSALYYSTNYGSTWTAGATTSIGFLSATNDFSRLYGYGSGGVYLSTNNGSSFTLQSNTVTYGVSGSANASNNCKFQMSSATGQYGIAYYNTSAYYTSNYGVTWTQATGLPTLLNNGGFVGMSSTGQYAFVDNTNGGNSTSTSLFYSTNYGASFSQSTIAGGTATGNHYTTTISSSGRYGICGNYITTNYGANWSLSTAINSLFTSTSGFTLGAIISGNELYNFHTMYGNKYVYNQQNATTNLFSQSLLITSDISTNSRLFIANDVSMASNLYVALTTILSGDISANARLFVGSDVSLNGNLFVNSRTIQGGDASMNNRLFVGADVSFGSRLFVASDISTNQRLFVGADSSFGGNFYVAGRTVKVGDISANARLFVGSDTSLNGNVYIGKDLTLNGNLYVKAYTTQQMITELSYQLIIAEDISVNGRLFLSNDASINGRLFVGADVSFGSRLIVNNDASFNGKLSVAGNVLINGLLSSATYQTNTVALSGFTIPTGASNLSVTTIYSQVACNSGYGYVSTNDGLYRTSDYGATWTLVNSTIGAVSAPTAVPQPLFADSTGQYVQAGTGGNSMTISISTNYGVTFTGVTAWSGTFWAQDGAGFFMNGAYGYVYWSQGRTAAAYSTTNYGQTWTLVTTPPAAILNGYGTFGITDNGAKYLKFARNGGTLYTSTDYGNTWTSSSATNGGTSIGISSDGKYIVSNSSGAVNVSSNYGTSFTTVTLTNATANISDLIYVSSDGSVMTIPNYYSTNYGVTWTYYTTQALYIAKNLSYTLGISGATLKYGLSTTYNTSLTGALNVSSDVSFGGNLFANSRTFLLGDVSANSRLYVGSDVSFGGKLFTVGDASLNGNVSIASDLTVNGNMYVKAYTTRQMITELSYQLIVAQDISVNGRLFLSNDASINNRLFVGSDASLGGNLFVNKILKPTTITEPFITNSGTTSPYTIDYSTGATFYITSPPASNFTVNITNVPSDINRTYVVTLIMTSTTNKTFGNSVQINGAVAITPNYANGIPTSLTSGNVITQSISIQRISVGDVSANNKVLSAVTEWY